jgi:outer membrane protein assembly factor BamA
LTKIRLQIPVLFFLFLSIRVQAQNNYSLHITGVDKDSATLVTQLGLQVVFPNRTDCQAYINNLPARLHAKGYITASLDSVVIDSTFARIVLFGGIAYQWALLDTRKIDPSVLEAVGWKEKMFINKPLDFTAVSSLREDMLNYMENIGYPFARVYLDSTVLNDDKVTAVLKIDRGPKYKIDSIRVYGNAKISKDFLQRYLDIPKASLYNKEKLVLIGKKIRDLPWMEEYKPADITRLGTGAVLNLYLRPRKSSQINVLIGLLPNNDQLSSKKLLLTGEANINLRNTLGKGESMGLNWQQLQVKSPRLHVFFQQPYVMHSPLGIDFAFDIFRRDTTFVNVNLQLGALYILNTNQSGKLFIQRFNTIVNGINKNFVLQNYRLPDEADVSSFNVGLDYEYINTNYRLNPVNGNEFRIITTVGSKQIKKNNEIVDLKDPGNPGFDFQTLYDTVKLKSKQLRVVVSGAHYFPLPGGRHTVKTAVNGGFFESGKIFRNELFQIGGYKLLRGFDEESQYLSQYAIGTVEYHYLVGLNSYFYVLADGGWGRANSQNNKNSYTYIGTGMGLSFETKAGIFNLAWAVGKRNDTQFNLRQSKIHLGFVNYF